MEPIELLIIRDDRSFVVKCGTCTGVNTFSTVFLFERIEEEGDEEEEGGEEEEKPRLREVLAQSSSLALTVIRPPSVPGHSWLSYENVPGLLKLYATVFSF